MRTARRLRVLTHNVKVGRRPRVVLRRLRRLIRRTNPDVILLQEAHGYVDVLADLEGYVLVVARGHGEAQGNPMLVRESLPMVRRRAIRCQTGWRGPKAGHKHRGRVYPVADVAGWRIVNVHRTRPGWSFDGEAFEEEFDRLLVAASAHVGPVVIAGDQNIGTRPGGDRGKHTPWALAEEIGGRIVTTTQGRIDYAVTRGVGGFARELGKYGSDHAAVLLVLTKEH